MVTQKFDLNMIPGKPKPIIRASQYDTGLRAFEVSLFAGTDTYTIPSGATLTVQGTKPDYTGFSYAATYSGNVVSFDCTDQMTACAGAVEMEIAVVNEGERVATANFVLQVEPAALKDDTIISETDIPIIEQLPEMMEDVDALISRFGSPNVASTAAQMTDTNKVYVYVGSESGYEYGHWYYHDPADNTWKSGGIYQSAGIVTNPSLTIRDMAADAEATGDRIKAAQYTMGQMISGDGGLRVFDNLRTEARPVHITTVSSEDRWTAGGETLFYEFAIGESATVKITAGSKATKYVRTDSVPTPFAQGDAYDVVDIAEGDTVHTLAPGETAEFTTAHPYAVAIQTKNENNENTTPVVFEINGVDYYINNAAALAAKQDTLTFDSTPTEGSTNPVTSGGVWDAVQTDKTLTVEDKAADAKITGDAITELKNDFNGIKENFSSYNIVHKTNISTKLGTFRYVNGVWGFTDAGAFGGGNFILVKYDAKPFYTYISKAYIYNSVCGMTFVDEDENILGTVGYDSSQGYSFKTVLISGTAPKGTAYVYVQENDGGKCSLGEYTPVISNELVTGLLRQNDSQSSFESVIGAVAYSGNLLDIRSNGAWEGWITEKFHVYPGETYTVRGCHMNIHPIGAYVTTDRVVSPIWRNENDTAYTVKCHEVTITIPNDVVELWVHRYNTWSIENSAIYPHLISKKGVFDGKTWYCIGDSITEYNITATKKYYDFIQEKTGILPISLAVGGRGYINGGSDDTNRFYQQIVNVPTTADVITVFGGGNDLTSFDLGDVTDTGTSTICGCINKTIDDLYSNFPLAKLGIITPNPWAGFPTTNDSNKMALLSDAIVEICRRRGVPCLNLYRCSGMRPWDTAFKSLVYDLSNNDGVHPNNIGHDMMASHIQEFVKSLII